MKRTSLMGALAAFGVVLCASTASADTTWKAHSVFPENRAEAKAFNLFAEGVNAATQGKLTLQFFHGGSLGLKDADLLRTLPAGAADMAMIFPDYLSRDAPILGQLFANGSANTPEENERVAPVLREFLTNFFNDRGLEVVGFYRAPLNQLSVFCRGEPVNSFEDLRGKKLRVWSKDLVDSFSALGVSAQIIPQSDLYIAMQTGVIDCAVYSHSLAVSISLQEVATSSSFLFLQAAAPVAAVANSDAWNALDEQTQAALKAEAEKMWDRSMAVAADPSLEEEAMKVTSAAGIKVLEPFSDADQAAFKKAAVEVWKASVESIGPEAVEIRQKVIEAISQ